MLSAHAARCGTGRMGFDSASSTRPKDSRECVVRVPDICEDVFTGIRFVPVRVAIADPGPRNDPLGVHTAAHVRIDRSPGVTQIYALTPLGSMCHVACVLPGAAVVVFTADPVHDPAADF